MLASQPAETPAFSLSTTRTAGNPSRTRSTVPSPEPLSTTTVSTSATLSRHCSIQGSALYVTTTHAARAAASAMLEPGPRAAAPEVFPEEDRRPREREHGGDEKDQESRRERLVGGHADAPEEADEERLAHREAVDRERDEQNEEEQRPHHVVDPRPPVDPDRLSGRPDGEHAHRLDRRREHEHHDQEADVAP